MEDLNKAIERLRGMGWYVPAVGELDIGEDDDGGWIKKKDGTNFKNRSGDEQGMLRLKESDKPIESKPNPENTQPSTELKAPEDQVAGI